MRTRCILRRYICVAAMASAVLAGCGQTPEELLASAKEHLAKNDHNTAVIQLRNALQESPDLAEARFLLGQALLDAGDPVGAEKELRRALELQYSAEHVVPPLTRALVMLGRYKEVVRDFGKVQVQSDQGKAEQLTAIGQSYLALGNADVARRAFSAAIGVQPKYVPAHLGQARVSARAGQFAEAMSTVDAAIAIAPDDPAALQLKGDLFASQKQIEPALAAYRKAVEVKPQAVTGHLAIVSLLLQENRPEDAAKHLETMKAAAPHHPQTLYMQALLAYRQKDFAAAKTSIQQQLRAAPNNLPGTLLAGAIDFELKAYAQAESHLSRVLAAAPQQRLARHMLTSTYLRTGQPGKALETLKPVLAQAEGDANTLALAGEVFMMNGDAKQASEYFEKSSRLDPKDARKRTALALTHAATGETDRAFRELEETAASDTGIRADLALIAGHLRRRDHDKALKAIDALEKKQPNHPLPHNLRGGALLGKGDRAGARRSFERALEIDPAFFPAAANLAQLDVADKKPDVARGRFEAILAKDPKNLQALLALAALRAHTDTRTGAEAARPDPEVVAQIGKAVSAHPTDPTPRLALIQYYLGKNDSKNAVAAAQEALSALPERAEVIDAAGRAYQAAGETHQALTLYRKLASLQPGSPQPYLRIADVYVATKNREGAIEALQKALSIKSDLLEAQRGLVALNVDAGRHRDAMSIAREVQKQRPKEAIGHALEGDIHASQKKWSEAAAAYREGLTKASSTELAARLHAALAASSSAEAERFAAAWLRDHPKDGAFRLYLAQAAGARKDYAGAAQHYRKLLDAQPNNAIVLNNLAWTESQLKDPKALEHAEKANELAPNHPAIMDTLGVMLVDRGDTARGLELLRKASTMAPQAAAIRLNLAKALIKAGQKDAARKELDELAKLGEKFQGHAEVAQLRREL